MIAFSKFGRHQQSTKLSKLTAGASMLISATTRGLERAVGSSSIVSIPSFLLPAFQSPVVRLFSSTSSQRSHIGRAPLSIPPEVNFTILPPSASRGGRLLSDGRPTVSIEGPRGKLSLSIPEFVNLEHDKVLRQATVSIGDRKERKQREMWGK